MNRIRVGYYQGAAATTVIMAGMTEVVSVYYMKIFCILLLVLVAVQIVFHTAVEGVTNGAKVFVSSMDNFTGKEPGEVLAHVFADSEYKLNEQQKDAAMAAMHIWGRTCEAQAFAWIKDGINKEEAINAKTESPG